MAIVSIASLAACVRLLLFRFLSPHSTKRNISSLYSQPYRTYIQNVYYVNETFLKMSADSASIKQGLDFNQMQSFMDLYS